MQYTLYSFEFLFAYKTYFVDVTEISRFQYPSMRRLRATDQLHHQFEQSRGPKKCELRSKFPVKQRVLSLNPLASFNSSIKTRFTARQSNGPPATD